MQLILFLVVSAVILTLAYRWVGRFLARFFALDPKVVTPAHELRDGMDYEPAKAPYLLSQHFSAIAAAGPIVGPILAGMWFGWLPTYLWIIIGCIFVGGIHDFTTLLASVRHKSRSIAEVVSRYMNRRSYLLFLFFIWISLIYVIIAFTDVTAGTFVKAAATADGTAPGPAVASSSMMYLLLAVLMGLSIRFLKMTPGRAKLLFLPLVIVAILAGPIIPFDISQIFGTTNPQVTWDYILLGYCFLASIAPIWLLLQPRGDLGGYFLYIIIVVGVVGIFVGGLSGDLTIQAPAVSNAEWFSFKDGLAPIFPILFITVACGACSGFHSIVASGTTSKQLDCELDAKPVAFGGMLLEGFFACLSLATVMILVKPAGSPDGIFAGGVAQFIHHGTFGLIPVDKAMQFGLLCFATFVFDTLDACTRLARYVLMELTGWKGRQGMMLATVLTLALPVLVLSLPPAELAGNKLPLWRVFWGLFGSSNQLLAALALTAVTVWVAHTGRRYWLTLTPALFMFAMTLWSLSLNLLQHTKRMDAGNVATLHHVEFGVGIVLIIMAVWLLVEACLVLRQYAINRVLPGEPVRG